VQFRCTHPGRDEGKAWKVNSENAGNNPKKINFLKANYLLIYTKL